MKRILEKTLPIGDCIFYYAMFLVFFSLIILLFSGCLSNKDIAMKYFDKHPNDFNYKCAFYYPVEQEYRPGEYIFLPGDTIISYADSVPCPPNIKDSIVYVKIPSYKIIHDTIKKVDTIFKESTAKQSVLKEQLQKEKEKNTNKWYIFFAGMLVIPFLIGAFYSLKKLL